ncbi:helix-turn-helix domain-containing protein [Actinomadura roseirufa]|uniref:helix-turn-helix domain-containing protein n=1 Tax=Actinomadura roseirufa TaxID=2094049 RepID=UPI001040F0EF|nr:helix-turn-helix transcriptional regulator [Actinomadura roseirufa]
MAPVESLDADASFKHWIASDLRFWREREGLSLSQMGQVMGCSRHTVSNIEHARESWNMNEDQADRLDAHLRLNNHFRRLVRYARTAHDPDWFADYVKHEKYALAIRTFRLSLFPGLLQTEAYARALLTSSRLVVDVEKAVHARMRRQKVLTREDPPHLWAVIDENVLHRPVGGPEVMREQVARLYEAAVLPHVTIRFVRQSSGFYLGLDGSFNTLSLERGEKVFVEAPGGGRLIQGGPELRDFGVRWDRIGASALPWDSSRDLMAEAMERFS